jgi:hypothetical protein
MDRRKIELPVGSLLGHEVANRDNTLKKAVAVFFPRLLALDSRQIGVAVSPHALWSFFKTWPFPSPDCATRLHKSPRDAHAHTVTGDQRF